MAERQDKMRCERKWRSLWGKNRDVRKSRETVRKSDCVKKKKRCEWKWGIFVGEKSVDVRKSGAECVKKWDKVLVNR